MNLKIVFCVRAYSVPFHATILHEILLRLKARGFHGMVLILVSRLSQQKEMGYPISYFGKNNFKEVPHAAGNDYKDTPSFQRDQAYAM
jgi:hypothetical protein